jgi:spore germination protein KB
MKNETLSLKQGVILIVLFISGTSTIITPGIAAKQDAWLALLLAMIFTLPMVLIFERFLYLFPGKDLFDIVQIVFGKFFGKLMIILFIHFSLEMGAGVLGNFVYFMNSVSLQSTPLIITTIFVAMLCVEGVLFGINILSRCGEVGILLLIIPLFLLIILLFKDININNLTPILYNGFKPVLKASFLVFSFPFAQIIIFTMVFTGFKEKAAHHIYKMGILLGGLLLLIICIINILVLGPNIAGMYNYSTYATFKRINLGGLFERVEIVIALVFFIGVVTKVSICLLATCKGVSKLFDFKDYKFIVFPMGVSMLILSITFYESLMDVPFFALHLWPYYSFLFQVILPIIIFIASEIHIKLKN